MAILKRYILSAIPALLLTGCYTDFNPDIDEPPTLCMNSLITAGETVSVELTHTWRYSAGIPGENIDINVTDATVEMWINGKSVETLTPVPADSDTDDGYDTAYGNFKPAALFVSDYAPREGDTVKLVAKSRDYGEAVAEVVVPVAVPVDKIEWTADIINAANYSYEIYMDLDINALVYITDPAPTANYYMVDYTVFNPEEENQTIGNITWAGCHGTLSIWSIDYEREPLFSEHISVLESIMGNDAFGYTIFSDRQFSGRTYPVHISFVNSRYLCLNPLDNEKLFESGIDIDILSVSESYYSWLISRWIIEEGFTGSLGNFGLGEMLFFHSNVSTGAGVVAARSIATATIDLKDFLRDNFRTLQPDSPVMPDSPITNER